MHIHCSGTVALFQVQSSRRILVMQQVFSKKCLLNKCISPIHDPGHCFFILPLLKPKIRESSLISPSSLFSNSMCLSSTNEHFNPSPLLLHWCTVPPSSPHKGKAPVWSLCSPSYPANQFSKQQEGRFS